MAKPSIKQTIRMTGEDIDGLLAEMNKQHEGGGSLQRLTKRWVMRSQKVVMTIVGDHDARTHFATIPRNLSTNGISLLHGGYLHLGQSCHVSIRGVDGRAESVAGEIVRCRHVRGEVHEIGIRFLDSINPREFFVETGGDYLFDAEHVVPAELHGRLLVVCENKADQKFIQHLFHESEIQFTFAEDGEKGLEQLAAEPDLAFVDDSLPGKVGIEFVLEAGLRALTTPIVLLSHTDDSAFRLAAIEAGAKEVIRRPFEPQVFYRAVAEFLMLSSMLESVDETTYLAASSDDDSKALFCNELKVLSKKMESAVKDEDIESVTIHLGRLSASAGVYGFPDLDKRAKATLERIRGGEKLETVRGEVERLGELCRLRGEESPSHSTPGQDEEPLKECA